MEKLEFIDSKFRLAILAAKRAKQLVTGSKKKIEASSENPLTVAMEEIRRGKIKYKIFEYDEQILERDETVSLLMGEDEDNEDQDNDDFLYDNQDDDMDDDQDDDDSL